MKKMKSLKGIDSFDEVINGYIIKNTVDKCYILKVGKTDRVTKSLGIFSTLKLAEERFYKGIKRVSSKGYVYKV